MRDEKRTYFSLPPKIAPFKCSILTVLNSPEFSPIVEKLSFILILGMNLVKRGISCKIDDGN
ncbi:MAG: hypothetical protein ACK52J_02780 [bacterium]